MMIHVSTLPASKKLPCNHIFHTSCLRSWFQRQQTCPTCRLNILRIPGERNTAANQAAGPEAQAQHAPDVPQPPHPGKIIIQIIFLFPVKSSGLQVY